MGIAFLDSQSVEIKINFTEEVEIRVRGPGNREQAVVNG